MKRHDDPSASSYFTTWSIKYPFDQCVDTVGRDRVAVWANQTGLPLEVMGRLRADFAKSNSSDVRPLLQSAVRQAEKDAIPLACLILGKA